MGGSSLQLTADHGSQGAGGGPGSLGQLQEKWDVLNTNPKGLGLKKGKHTEPAHMLTTGNAGAGGLAVQ